MGVLQPPPDGDRGAVEIRLRVPLLAKRLEGVGEQSRDLLTLLEEGGRARKRHAFSRSAVSFEVLAVMTMTSSEAGEAAGFARIVWAPAGSGRCRWPAGERLLSGPERSGNPRI